MNQVFVLSNDKQPLMPCSPARARQLLKDKQAAVYRRYPFTIILKNRADGDVQPVELRLDPGSKTTGVALVANDKLQWAANLTHRGYQIKEALDKRRAIRRSRRNRKTRYRPARFNNRTRPKGWLPPSLMSRVYNVQTWAKRLSKYCPISSVAVETVRFDMQKMANHEISGVEYQQGALFGYEVREYLLEKFNRTCVYCNAQNVPLEIEHVIPKSKGGTNSVNNLVVACVECNRKKSNKSLDEFLAKKPEVLKRVKSQLKATMKDAAAVNATRYKVGEVLKSQFNNVTFWSGGRTKFNRTRQHYHKDHFVDAACVGEHGINVLIKPNYKPLQIKAMGRGNRQAQRVDGYGFPLKQHPKLKQKRVFGFGTGDLVKVTDGKHKGKVARISIRQTGSFNFGKCGSVVYKKIKLIHMQDGYNYN